MRRLAPERVDHVPVVDHVGMPSVAGRASARERHEMARAEEDLEPVVVDACAQPVPDQARGHGVSVVR